MKRQSQELEPLAKGLALYLENEKRGARTEPGEEQGETEKCYVNKKENLPSPKHRAKDKDLYKSSSKDHPPPPAPVRVEPVRQVPHRAPLQDERLNPCLVVSLLLLLLNKRQVPRHLPLPRPHPRRHLVLPQGAAWFRAHAFNTSAVRQVPLTVEVQVVPEEDSRRLFNHHLTFAAPENPRGYVYGLEQQKSTCEEVHTVEDAATRRIAWPSVGILPSQAPERGKCLTGTCKRKMKILHNCCGLDCCYCIPFLLASSLGKGE